MPCPAHQTQNALSLQSQGLQKECTVQACPGRMARDGLWEAKT